MFDSSRDLGPWVGGRSFRTLGGVAGAFGSLYLSPATGFGAQSGGFVFSPQYLRG